MTTFVFTDPLYSAHFKYKAIGLASNRIDVIIIMNCKLKGRMKRCDVCGRIEYF